MSNNGDDKLSTAMERISMVLGALYASQMGDLDQSIKAERLSRCGFSNTEIADLLATSPNTINVALHKARRKKKKKIAPKKSK
jgi:DNA-binding NarL/FixJ family response regulator